MKKGFLILVGNHEAKNILQKYLQQDYWVWNVSPYNHVRHNEDSMGWKYDDTETSDEFIGKIISLRNEYYDYEYQYITSFIPKIFSSTKAEENSKIADIAIAHGLNRELIERLCSEHDFQILNCTLEKHQVENNFTDGKYDIAMKDSKQNIIKSIDNIMKYVCIEKQGE